MHKNTTTPLLVHFEDFERRKLAGGQGEAESVIGKKLSQTRIVKATINMVLDDPKLRQRLIWALRSEFVDDLPPKKSPAAQPTIQRVTPRA